MDERANPAPLGLMGFGMTTVLLNIFNAGFFETTSFSMILAMGICYGGLAQVIAGIMEFRKNNVFGLTAFTSYGLFWLSFVFIKQPWVGSGAEDAGFIAWYLFMWGLFFTLAVLFWLLAIGDWTGNETITKIAGWEGIVCGASAIYLAAAEVFKDTYGKEILPIGVIKR
jgi:succinate-acetate transporter protein